jgi:hypothetical protein
VADTDKPDLHVVPVNPDGPSTPPGMAPDDEDTFTAEPLNARELLLVEAIAKGESLADSATAAGISYRTARRWRLKVSVAEQIRNRISENLAQTRAILSAGSSRAARALVDMSDGKKVADAPTVSAARAVVDCTSRLVELQEMESRLADVEARLNTGGRR